MHEQRTKADFSNQEIYVGIDVHKNSWNVSIMTETIEHKSFTQDPSATDLIEYLQRNFPGARVRCAYEAGFSGFSAARLLHANGIECLVIHPADVPTTQQERVHKNDRMDSRRLARGLRQKVLRSIYIPAPDAVADRFLVRTRRDIIVKQTRCKTQIRMQLHNLGVDIPSYMKSSHWSRRFIAWLEELTITNDNDTFAMRMHVEQILFLREQLLAVTQRIRRLAQTEPYRGPATLLQTIPGIGAITAMVLLTELVDIQRFATGDELASYVGLIPGEHSSGEHTRNTGLSCRRNAFLRHVLIESTWVAVRHDPALQQAFENAARRMIKSKAIVLVARRFLNRIRAVLLTGEPYLIGSTRVIWPRKQAQEILAQDYQSQTLTH
jgi:transposase